MGLLMRIGRQRQKDQRGFAVVAAIVLLALFFFIGAAMALGVSSSLHSIADISGQDQVSYAAESAVSRGLAAILQSPSSPSCPSGAGVNGQTTAVACFSISGVSVATGNYATSPRQWQFPAQVVNVGSCVSFSLDVDLDDETGPEAGTVWLVVAWRPIAAGSGPPVAWIDNNQNCSSNGNGSTCSQAAGPGSTVYATCSVTDSDFVTLHVGSQAGTVALDPMVVRRAVAGADCIVTAVGQAAAIVKEADVMLPSCTAAGASVSLWHQAAP